MADGTIEGEDLISKSALEAPGKLADQLDRVLAAINRILEASKKSEAVISSSKSTSKVAKETDGLAKSQRELAKVQEKAAQIAKVVWLSQNEVAESQKRAVQSGKQMGAVVSDLDKKMASAANSATALGGAQEYSNKESVKAASVYKVEAGSLQELTKRRVELRTEIKSNSEAQKVATKSFKDGDISLAAYNKRMTESESVIVRNRAAISTLNAQIKTHILSNSQLGNEYKKLIINLESARNKYKDLAASGTATTQQLKAQQKVFEALNKKVLTIDNAVGQFQRNVGNYPQTFGIATQSVTRFLSAFGLVTGLALFAKTIKEVIGLNADFEKTNSRLQGTLGATKSEIEGLRAQQVKLGETTIYTAKQYGELQIELAKLGFPIADIEAMTESTAQAAIAMGSELAPQAELTGSTIRAYGLEASDAAMVNDQLSKSTTTSALSFSKLATALPYVASSAKLLGFSLDETLALMGQLSNTGLEASTIGTSLRSIFLKLADSGSDLSKRFKDPVRDLPALLKGLGQLQKEGIDLGEALELTDKRSVTAFASLVAGADKVEKLNGAIKDSVGFTNELAKTVSDNLAGDFILLESATAALATEIGGSLNNSLRAVAQTATLFVNSLRELPSFIKENKSLFIALGIAILGLNTAVISSTASLIAYEWGFKKLVIQQAYADFSTKKLWATLAANPLGIILVTLAALVVAVDQYDKNSRRALEVEKERNELNKGIEQQTKNIAEAQKTLNVSTEDWLKLSDSQKKSIAEQIEFTINHTKVMIARLKVQKEQLTETAKELTLWQQIKLVASNIYTPALAGAQAYGYAQENAQEATKGSSEAIANLEKELDGLTHLLDANTKAEKENTNQKKKLTEEQIKAAEKARKEALKAQLELDAFRLQQQAKTLEEIQNNEKNATQTRIDASIKLEQVRKDLADNARKQELVEEVKYAADGTLIEEKYQAGLTDAEKKGIDDRAKLREDDRAKEIQRRIEAVANDAVRAQVAAENLIKQRVVDRILTVKEGKEQLAALRTKLSTQAVDEQIKALESILYTEDTTAEERAQIAILLDKLKQDLLDAEFDNASEEAQKIIDLENFKTQKILEAYRALEQGIIQVIGNLSEARVQDIDSELRALEESTAKQIKLAGDNEEAKKRIEEQGEKRRKVLEDKKRREQTKAAKTEKAAALITAGIRTALAVLNALSTVQPYPAAVVAAVSAGVIGAAEIAAIATKPIPQFFAGAEPGEHKGGLAWVGERGMELMRTPSGEVSLSPNNATLMNLPKGTEVIPHDQTMNMLAMSALGNSMRSDRQDGVSREMIGGLKSIEKAIVNSRQPQINLVHNGGALYEYMKHSDGFVKAHRKMNVR